MLDGFIRVAAASPKVRVGDVDYNVSQTVEFAKKAADNDCAVAVFPELGLTGYTCGDLFLQNALLDKAIEGLYDLAEQTADLNTVIIGIAHAELMKFVGIFGYVITVFV